MQIKLPELQTCTEYLPEWGRAAYSIFILLFQFLLPMITLICAYYQGGTWICHKSVTVQLIGTRKDPTDLAEFSLTKELETDLPLHKMGIDELVFEETVVVSFDVLILSKRNGFMMGRSITWLYFV